MIRSLQLKLALPLAVGLLFWTLPASACSSCGSGGSAPLFLQPNEEVKTYVGVSQRTSFRDILSDGEVTRSYGRERQFTYLTSLGLRLTSMSFASLSVPYLENHRSGSQVGGFGDPSLDLRWTLIQQAIDQPAIPQVQLLGTFKKAVARSAATSKNPYFLDAIGTGHDQINLGIDVWFAMWPVVFGATYSHGVHFEKEVNGQRQKPGAEHLIVATIGYNGIGFGKLIGGVVNRRTESRELEGRKLPKSQIQTNNPYVTCEFKTDMINSWRVTYVKEGTFDSKNTVRADNISLGYMKVY